MSTSDAQPTELRHLLELLQSERLTIPSSGVLRTPPNVPHHLHVVSAAKILLVVEGSLTYVINDLTVTLEEGAMLYRPAMSSASWRSGPAGPMHLMFCEFSVEQMSLPVHAMWTRPADAETDRLSLERIRHAFLDPDETSAFLAEAESKALLTRFFRHAMAVRLSGATARGRSGAAGERAVRTALALLAEHYAEVDILTGLHDRVRMSEDHFRRVFRRITGLSPQQYLLRVRLETAKAYLEKSNLSVKEVARAVGYPDALYFSRLYRSRFHHSPKAARETGNSSQA